MAERAFKVAVYVRDREFATLWPGVWNIKTRSLVFVRPVSPAKEWDRTVVFEQTVTCACPIPVKMAAHAERPMPHHLNAPARREPVPRCAPQSSIPASRIRVRITRLARKHKMGGTTDARVRPTLSDGIVNGRYKPVGAY